MITQQWRKHTDHGLYALVVEVKNQQVIVGAAVFSDLMVEGGWHLHDQITEAPRVGSEESGVAVHHHAEARHD